LFTVVQTKNHDYFTSLVQSHNLLHNAVLFCSSWSTCWTV